MVKTLYFVRHGQSTANAGGITMDNWAIPLSPLGQQQSQALARQVPQRLPACPPKVYTSSFLRTQQTAAPYCATVQVLPHVHPLFHEFTNIDPALLLGMTGDERWPLTEAYWAKANPNQREGEHAETFTELHERVNRLMAELPDFAHETVLFGHGMFFALMVWQSLGFNSVPTCASMAAFRQFQLALPVPNTGIYRLLLGIDGLLQIQQHL